MQSGWRIFISFWSRTTDSHICCPAKIVGETDPAVSCLESMLWPLCHSAAISMCAGLIKVVEA